MINVWKALGLSGDWWVEGWDTFAGEAYRVSGNHRSKASATRAAHAYLRRLNRTQPVETSGGQDGIQDQVYVRGPGGESIRIRLDG